MSVVNISPEAARWPYLTQGGEYGNGRTHNCEVEVFKIEMPSEHGPGWDYDCKKEPEFGYCEFTFKVDHEEMGQVFVKEHQPLRPNSGSKALAYLHALAPQHVNLETGDIDLEAIVGLPCAIEVKDPVEQTSTGKMYTGNVTNVFGI